MKNYETGKKDMDIISVEKLQLYVSPSFGAVIEYEDYVFVTDTHYDDKYSAKIYVTKNVNEQRSDKRKLELFLESDNYFKSSGEAIKWCFENIATDKQKGGATNA